MKRTHKKMLGFAGLGLVAVATAVAAVLPTPLASAANITDTIMVRVESTQPGIVFTKNSGTGGAEITNPEYSFSLEYTGLKELKVEIYKRDEKGEISDLEILYNNSSLDTPNGTYDKTLNLDEYGGFGHYEIVASGKTTDNVDISGVSLSFFYKESKNPVPSDPDTPIDIPKAEVKSASVYLHEYDTSNPTVPGSEFTPPCRKNYPNVTSPLNVNLNDTEYTNCVAGVEKLWLEIVLRDVDTDPIKTIWRLVDISEEGKNIVVPFDSEIDVVTTIETSIFDENGNLVRTVVTDRATGIGTIYDKDGNKLFEAAGVYENGKLNFPMDGLAYGIYKAEVRFKNSNQKQIGNTLIYTIDYTSGTPIIVPDTGSFFQGLNISREDYLITGIVVFAIIGVVGFGIVKKTHGTKRIGGRNRR